MDHPTHSPDTTDDAARVQLEALRRLDPESKLRMTLELSQNVRDLLRAGIRMRHPDFDEAAVTREVVRLTAGEEIWRAVYPDAAPR